MVFIRFGRCCRKQRSDWPWRWGHGNERPMRRRYRWNAMTDRCTSTSSMNSLATSHLERDRNNKKGRKKENAEKSSVKPRISAREDDGRRPAVLGHFSHFSHSFFIVIFCSFFSLKTEATTMRSRCVPFGFRW